MLSLCQALNVIERFSSLTLAVTLAATACAPERAPADNISNNVSTSASAGPTAPGYELDREGNDLVDKRLAESNDPSIKSLKFYFDLNYERGSLAIQLCFRDIGGFRLISRELKPRPGFLVNLPYAYSEGCVTKYPVTDLAIDDDAQVHVGIRHSDEPVERAYQKTRAYRVVRSAQALLGQFLGIQTVDPNTIKPRDQSVQQYFK